MDSAMVSSGTPHPHALAAAIAAGRNLTADVFDTYLYNTLRFNTSTLAPFIQRAKADGVSHLVRRAAAGSAGGSLFLPIPGSIFAIELLAERGLEGEAAYPRAWDVCSAV